MKPNQEISLKFWIAMIVFFAVVLSIPLMSYLIDKKVITYDDVSAFYFVCFTTASCFYMILVLRHSEIKTKFNKETFFSNVSTQTITDYDNKIKAQESNMNELKQAFEDAVAEITELRSQNGVLRCKVKDLTYNRDHWKERALHQKHTKKEIDTTNIDVWECQKNYFGLFEKGKTYQEDKTSKIIHESKIWLFVNPYHLHPYLVNKSDFKPVKP